MEYMDRPAIEICEAFAHAGYPLDVEAHADHRGRGLGGRDRRHARAASSTIAKRFSPKSHAGVASRRPRRAAIWKGRKSAFGAMGRIADYICMDGTIPTGQLALRAASASARSATGYGLARRQRLPRRRRQPASADHVRHQQARARCEKAEAAGDDILKLCVEVGGCLTGEHGVGIEKRDLMRYQFNPADLEQQMRVRAVFDPAGCSTRPRCSRWTGGWRQRRCHSGRAAGSGPEP